MERTAIFPGSFDPFTRGHAALVEEALRLFDRIVIGIGSNTSKQGLLNVENRKRLIDDLYAGDPRIETRIYTGLTGDFARAAGACAMIRGVRNTADFEFERTMQSANRRLFPTLTTVMLCTPGDVADISSSTVRELLAFGHSATEFLPAGTDITKYL
ncbi:pantetheine-phosphate adenylyltransferase [uncultured Alistipes sp.]|jgi:pantetheine-phosphate adenylyltransferase|uniref:pantetheine-phosphate adenylyltransferase n=1 Tax=uncultured Alistipes sp. TaxID=538949 RepID=UPI0025F02620|nr:pantetheine-phosphate adenylyltransferase [uncultured Alistipes sp.]